MLFSKLTTSAFVLFMCTNLNAQGCADLVLDAGVDTSICGGQNYALGGTPSAQWVGSGNPTLNYNWYNSANTLLASVSNPVVAINQADTYMLVVDDGAGCSDTAYVTISDLPSPVADSLGMTGSGAGYQTILHNGELLFRRCSNNSNFNGNFTFTDPDLTSYPINTSIVCIWGDGNIDTFAYTGVSINMTHLYTPGAYDFTYVVTFPLGCSSQGDFNVFVGVPPPALTIGASGNSFCLPGFYEISIESSFEPPGTEYGIQINDGTDTSFVGLPSNPFIFQHLFTASSCGINSIIQNTTYSDSYSIQVTSSNGCSLQGTFAAIGPIEVGESTNADFTQSSNEVCVGGEVVFNNTSETGSNILFSGGCDTLTALYWEVSPSSGFTVANGVLGSNNGFINGGSSYYDYGSWSSGSDQLELQFDSAGVYDITLFIGNDCGMDSLTQQVCVLPQPTANFDLSNDSFCTSELVSTTNNSAGLACGFQFESDWQVTYDNPLNCSPNSGVNFVNSTDTTSFEPVLDFIGPGNYEITLTTSYPGSIPGCLSDQMVDSVFVQSPPEIQLVPLGDSICEGEDVQFTGSVVDCYDSTTIYTWYFEVEPGILIFNSSTLTPNVTYNTSGTFTYSLEATNICGNNIIMDSIVVNPDVFIDAGTDQAACLNTTLDLNGVISGGTTSGVWSANVAGGSFGDPNALITTYTPPINFSGQITITLTSIDPVGPCPSNSDSFIYTISDEAVVDAMPDATVCEGELVTLIASLQGAASTATWSDNGAGGQIINENQSTGFAQYILPSGVNQVVLFVETDVPSPLCPSDIDSVVITILDLPTISSLSDQTVCDGSTTQAVVFNGTGTQYSWTNSDPSIGLASSGFGDIAPFTAQNGGQSAVNALVTVTPEYTSGGVTCPGSTEDFTITVNPLPTIDTISDQTFCEGDQILSIDFTSSPGTSFTWTNDNTQTGLGASGSGSIPSFTTTNGTTQPVISLITVTPTLNGCIGPDMTFTLTVNPVPVVDALPSIDTCSGTLLSISFTGTATQYNWTNDNTTIGLGASGTGTFDFTTLNTGTSSELATVAVTPGYLLNNLLCPGSTEIFTITVQPVPHVLSLQDQTICNGDQTQLVSFGSDVLGTSYAWTNDNPQIGLSSTGSQDIPSFTGTNSGNTSIVGTVTVSPFVNGCPGPDSTLQFTINPTPVITTSQLSDILCSTDSSTPVAWTSNVIGTSYTWTGSITSGSLTGAVLSGTGDLQSMQLTNTGSVPAILEYTVTPEANGCSGGSITYIIVVNPIPDLSPIAPEVICGGTSFTAPVFTSTVSGTSYTWTLDQPGNVPATLTGYQLSGSGALPSQTINNSGNSPYTLDYIVTPTADGCIGPDMTFSLTINPAPVVSFSLPSQVICSGAVSSQVGLSSTTPNVTFDWIASSVPAGVSGVSPLQQDTSNIPSMTLTHNSVLPEVVTFTATATTSGGAACPGSPSDYTITINPVPSVSTVTDQTVCDGSTTQAVVFNGTGTQYSWTNSDPSIGLASSGFGDIAPFTAQNGGQSAVNALVTVTPEYTSGGVTCSGSTEDFTITVNPLPTIDTISDQTFCEGDQTLSIDFTSSPGTSFTWTNDNTQTGLGASGSGSIPSFTTTNGTTQPVISLITVTPTLNGCIGPDMTFTLTVNPVPVVDALPSIDTCSGTLLSISFTGTATQYNWTNDNTTIGLGASGTGTFDFTTLNTGTSSELATVAVTPGYLLNNLLCPGSTEIFTITVQPVPHVLSLQDQTICNGDQTQLVSFGSDVLGTSYAWTNDNPQIGLSSTGSQDIPSFTGTNSGNTSIVGTVTVSPFVNGCPGPDSTLQFTINPTPVITTSQLSDILCSTDSSTPVAWTSNVIGTSYTWTGSITSGSLTGAVLSGTGDLQSMQLTNTGSVPAILEYTVTPEANGCSGGSITYIIVVNPIPDLSPIAPEVICGGTSFTAPVFTSTVSGTSYTWTLDQPGNVPATLTGYQLSGSGALPSQTINNSGNSPYTLDYIVTPTADGCIGPDMTFSLTINPAPVVSFSLPSQVICSGAVSSQVGLSSTTPNVTFDWIASSVPAGVSGVSPLQQDTSNIPSMTLTHNSVLPEVVTFTATATTSGGAACPGSPSDYTITINPVPSVSTVTDQTVCDGSTTQAVVFNGTGTQYSWTNSDPSIGLASSGFGDIAPFTAQNGGQSAVNALVTVTPEYTSGGVTCSGSTEDFTITVNPLPTIDTISDQTFCEGDQTLSIDFTSSPGTSFTWTNDNTQTGLGASGSGSIPSFTTTNGTTQPVISLITVTPTLNGCIGPDMTFTLTVNPVPVVDALPSIDTCSGTLLSISFTGTATQYNWTNDNTTIGLGASGTGTFDFTTLNTGTSSELATVAVTPGYLLNNLLCPGSTEIFTITVQPVPHVLSLQDQTICNGDQTQLVSFGSDVLGTSYAWTNDNPQIGLSSTGSQDIPSFTGTNSGNTSIVGTVTVSPFVNGCPGPDSTLQFTINPTPVITTSQLSDILCSTDSSTPVAWTSNVIGTSYAWTGVVTSGAVSGAVLNGTGDLPSMQLTNTGSVPAILEYTVTPEANGCSGGSITYTIVVNPIPDLDPIAPEVICGGTSFTAPVFTSTVSGTSYTWTLDQPGNVPATLTGYQLSGSGALPSQTINNSGNSPYTLDYIVTPTADGCIGPDMTFSLTINPAPVVSFSPSSQVLCSGDVSSQVGLSSTTPNVTFDWIASSVPAGVSGVSPLQQDTSNIPSMTLTHNSVLPEVVTFTATATTSGGAACPGSPSDYTITINPVPSVSTVTDQTVCDGSTTQAVVFNGTGTQYSWTNSDPSIGLASSGFGDIAPFTAQNGGQSAVNALVTVTPEYTSGGVTCSGSPFTFSFTVDPTPFVNPVVDQELCIGDLSQPIIFTGTASNYNWTNTNTASGAAGSGVGIVNSFVAQNNTNQVLTSSFEVIPEANGCIGSSIFFVIDVNPETSVSPIGNMEFCSGDQTSIVSFSGGGLSYSWTNDTPSIGLPASGVGPIASFTTTNGTNVPLQATITVTPLFVGGLTSCPGSSAQFTITVNPIPTVLPVADQVICNGSSSQAVQFSGTNASAFQWTASSTSIGIPASGTGTIQSFTTVNSGSNSEISNVVVTPELASNGLVCFGSPESFDFIINPSPSVTAISDILVCEGETVPSTLIAGNATSFDWTSAPSNTGVQTSGSGNIPSFIAINSTNQPISDVVTITPNFSGSGLSCPGVPLSFAITVNPSPEVDPLSDQVLCSGSSTSPVLFNGTATNYAWTNSAPSIGLLSPGNGDISSFTAGNLGQSEVVSIFEVTPEYTAGGLTCIGNQELFTITVNPTPIIDPLSDLASCSGDDIGPIIFTGISTSFNWTNTNTGIGIPSSGTGNIGIVNSSNTGAVTENTTITVTPEYTFAGLTCIGSSESFSIGVLPNPTINSIPDYTYCNNESTVPVNFSGLATEFTWTNTNPQIGLASNGVGDISSFTVINSGAAVETASVSITPGYTDIGITCQGTPQLFNITVNPAPTINSVPDLIVCNGDQVSAINFSGTATNFSWSNSEPSIGLLNSGNGNIPSFSAINTGITPVTATITVESSFGSNGVQCTGITESFTITVNPTPTVDPIADQVVCDGTSTNTVTLIGSGTSYTWTNTLPSIGISSNGTGDIPAFSALNTSSLPVTANFTVVPVALQCSGTAELFSLTVNPTPTVDPIASIEGCTGVVQPVIQPTGNFSSISWTNSNATIGIPSFGTAQIPSFTLSNPSNATVNQSVVIFTPINTNAGVQCFGLQTQFDISVNPSPEADPIADIELCNGESSSIVSLTGSGSFYEWTNSNPSIGLAGAGNGDVPVFNATNTQNSDTTALISLTPIYQSSSGQLCSGTGTDFNFIVHPSPLIDTVGIATVCSGDDLNVNLSASVPSLISWSAIDNPDVLGESTFLQTLPTINNTLTNNVATIESVTYEVSANSLPYGCVGPTYSFDALVIPEVFITSSPTIEICSGVSASVFLTTNIPSDFIWFATDNPNVIGESQVFGTGNIINDVLINTSLTPQIVVYSVIPTSQQGACQGLAQTVSVLVNPPIELISPLSSEICSGDVVDMNLVANANVNFSWFAQSSLEVNGESLTIQNGSVIDDQLENTTLVPQSVFYTVVATTQANGCSSPSTQVEVVVNPVPVVDPLNVVLCSGETVNAGLTASSTSSFEWYADPNNNVTGETQIPQNTSLINDQLINSGVVAETVLYSIQATSDKGCVGPILVQPVLVNPLPEVDFIISNQILCEIDSIYFVNNSNPAYSFLWDFGDGDSSSVFEPSHIYGATGNYTVTLTAVDPQTNCINIDESNVLIQESPPVDFVVNQTEGCIPANFVFTDLNNLPDVDVVWDFGDGQLSNQPGSIDHTYADTGCFTVTLTATNAIGCVSTFSNTDMVCVYENPIAFFTAEETIVPADDPFVYFINNSQYADTYVWDFGDGATSFSENPVHLYPEGAANYEVLLTASNASGCFDQFVLTIVLWEEELIYVPNSFTPNGDGSNDIFKPIITAGFDKESYQLLIFNRWGEMVFESYDPNVGWDGTFGTSQSFESQDGTYTWRITLRGLQDEDATLFLGHVNLLK